MNNQIISPLDILMHISNWVTPIIVAMVSGLISGLFMLIVGRMNSLETDVKDNREALNKSIDEIYNKIWEHHAQILKDYPTKQDLANLENKLLDAIRNR